MQEARYTLIAKPPAVSYLWFEVPVYHSLAVHGLYSVDKLSEDGAGSGLREAALLLQSVQ